MVVMSDCRKKERRRASIQCDTEVGKKGKRADRILKKMNGIGTQHIFPWKSILQAGRRQAPNTQWVMATLTAIRSYS